MDIQEQRPARDWWAWKVLIAWALLVGGGAVLFLGAGMAIASHDFVMESVTHIGLGEIWERRPAREGLLRWSWAMVAVTGISMMAGGLTLRRRL